MSPDTDREPRPRAETDGPQIPANWRGTIFAMFVGISFASSTVLAAVAYTGAATPVAVILARTAVAFVVLNFWLAARGVPRALPWPQRRIALFVGALFAAYSFAILLAIQYLPVGVVVATFYTFPLMIAAIEWASGRHPFSWRTALALMTAFVGVVFALDAFGASLHLGGTALALFAAVGVTCVMGLSARARGDGDSRPVTLHMLGVALAIFVLVAVVHGGAALPHTGVAWAAFIAGPLFYTFAVIAIFVVFADIGPLKASIIMNIEPVTSVVLGYLLLGQHLGLLQLVGIGLVVGSVLAVESASD